jgi:hypothetical protein
MPKLGAGALAQAEYSKTNSGRKIDAHLVSA